MDLSITNYLLIIGVDIFMIILLLMIFLRYGHRKDNTGKIDILKIKNLKSSLEQVMSESKKTSQELLRSFNERIIELNLFLKEIDNKEKHLEKCITQAEEMLKKVNHSNNKDRHEIADPYQKATELISLGYSNEDVRKQSGLSLSEIGLIKQIGRYKSN